MRSKSIEKEISIATLLSQAYSDNWDYYQKSLKTDSFPVWDYVFLTASNNHQALMYRQQINIRKDYLPKKTKYIVIPDEKETRIGSGGATLSVIKYIKEMANGSHKNEQILIFNNYAGYGICDGSVDKHAYFCCCKDAK